MGAVGQGRWEAVSSSAVRSIWVEAPRTEKVLAEGAGQGTGLGAEAGWGQGLKPEEGRPERGLAESQVSHEV